MEANRNNRISIKLNPQAPQAPKEAKPKKEQPSIKKREEAHSDYLFIETQPDETIEESGSTTPQVTEDPFLIQPDTTTAADEENDLTGESEAMERLNQLRGQLQTERTSAPSTRDYIATRDPMVNAEREHGRESLYEDKTETESHYLLYDLMDESEDSDQKHGLGSIVHDWFQRFTSNNSTLSRNPLLRTLVSMFGAVTLGLIFGFIVLTVFMQENSAPKSQEVAAVTAPADGQPAGDAAVATEPAPGQPADPNISETGGAGEGERVPVAVELPEQSFFMVQAGVFSDGEAAQTAIQPLDSQGFPHFMYEMTDGKKHLFIAAASSRDQILGMASFYKEKQMEVFVKEVKMAAERTNLELTQAPTLNVGTAANQGPLYEFFQSGANLSKELTTWSSQVINNPAETKAMPKEQLDKLTSLHRQFLEQSRLIQPLLPKEAQPHATEMINSLNKAVTTVKELKSNNAVSYAWQVQKGILTYLEHYAAWVKPTA
ncbi:hypothetical protein [Brevibacillus dissolubilis]|uniref:hypothetical protein n=1 Tax=Brevibacillus dissolubilis TaxID=1844116 RepID=UPI00111702FD|nr:hypothetical protein [Brevibacillus dissolubilis]